MKRGYASARRQGHSLEAASIRPAGTENGTSHVVRGTVTGLRSPIDERETASLGCAPVSFQSSSMVEHAAVNRVVVGSSPTSGATLKVIAHQ